MKTFKPLKAVERLERLGSVDPATGVLQRALHRALAARGLADWSAGHPQQLRAGLVHAEGNTLATSCFALSLAARIRTTGTGRA